MGIMIWMVIKETRNAKQRELLNQTEGKGSCSSLLNHLTWS